MLTHVWSMSFTDATTDEQRDAFNCAMAELPNKITGVESFRSGTDLGLNLAITTSRSWLSSLPPTHGRRTSKTPRTSPS